MAALESIAISLYQNCKNMTDDGVTSSSTPSLWIDADPSGLYQTGLDCDDDLAILIAIALHQRQIINLTGLSICGGNAPQ